MQSERFRPRGTDRVSRDFLIRLGFTGVSAAALVASAFLAAAFDRFPGDLTVSVWVQSWHAPWFETLASAVSLEENGLVILLSMVLVVVGLFVSGWRRESYLLLGSTVSGAVVIEIAKALIARPRPSPELVLVFQEVTSNSFPSGNVSLFSVYLMALAYVVASRTPNPRKAFAAYVLAGLVLAFTGFSRVYLGAHWLSDVLGGYLLGLTWTLIANQAANAVSAYRDRRTGTG